ncbi:MAG: hypothetical protein ACI828_002804 [Flavobacteriales bacterium]|jgi:hypothetical protein
MLLKTQQILSLLLMSVLLLPTLKLSAQKNKVNKGIADPVDFLMDDLISQKSHNAAILGNPKIIDSPYGDAVLFNGIDDGIFLDFTPLLHLQDFTVEVIMRPDTNGLAEQRFLHLGEMVGDRIMLETRLTNDGFWYVDGLLASGGFRVIFIDPKKLHPLNEWYNVAMVNKNGKVELFINGKSEFKGELSFSPFKKGKSSIGVRQNKVFWYKGAIYKMRITPRALKPSGLLPLKNQ